MPKGAEIQKDKKWLAAQGLTVRDLNRFMRCYRPDSLETVMFSPTTTIATSIGIRAGCLFHRAHYRGGLEHGS